MSSHETFPAARIKTPGSGFCSNQSHAKHTWEQPSCFRGKCILVFLFMYKLWPSERSPTKMFLLESVFFFLNKYVADWLQLLWLRASPCHSGGPQLFRRMLACSGWWWVMEMDWWLTDKHLLQIDLIARIVLDILPGNEWGRGVPESWW